MMILVIRRKNGHLRFFFTSAATATATATDTRTAVETTNDKNTG